MKSFGLFILSLLFLRLAFAQGDTTGLVRYTPDFQFKEGLFITFDEVKSNSPVSKVRIITTVEVDDPDYFEKVTESETISFFDPFGVKKDIETKKIWGYSKNGILYINYQNKFSRIPIVGKICHFIADITVYHTRYNDPYYYSNYYNAYPMRPQTYTSDEMHQFLLDFETGKVMNYDYDNLAVILMRDPVLFDEFNNLRKSQKSKMKFFYLRKYNERNPLYLPSP